MKIAGVALWIWVLGVVVLASIGTLLISGARSTSSPTVKERAIAYFEVTKSETIPELDPKKRASALPHGDRMEHEASQKAEWVRFKSAEHALEEAEAKSGGRPSYLKALRNWRGERINVTVNLQAGELYGEVQEFRNKLAEIEGMNFDEAVAFGETVSRRAKSHAAAR